MNFKKRLQPSCNPRSVGKTAKGQPMPWIKTIPFDAATGKLRDLYTRVTGPGNNVDNIMMMHSLRPHTMEGHMAIYKYVLHHRDNTIPKWFLEALGVWVSSLNDCTYCVEHHFAGMKRLMAGWNDGEILEINQVTAYFAYANRTVLGLGCSTQGDIIGLSPNNNDDPDDWGHS
mgnify:CR=1 FL=1